MTTGALLTIGCNDYEKLDKLNCCEKDAQQIREDLLLSDLYSPEKSIVLASPTFDEIQQTLRSSIEIFSNTDILTVYFSGHGGVVDAGSYYLSPIVTMNDSLQPRASQLVRSYGGRQT